MVLVCVNSVNLCYVLYIITYMYGCWNLSPVDMTVIWANNAAMNNHGQNCCAGSRTFVHEKIYDEFVKKAKAAGENRMIGDPWDPIVAQGPQVGNIWLRVHIKPVLKDAKF